RTSDLTPLGIASLLIKISANVQQPSPGGATELSPALQRWESSIDDSSPGGTTEFSCTLVLPYVDLTVPKFFGSTAAARAAFSRPYTKKKNAASTRKNNVKPNIFASYLHTEVICFAGKNANAIPSAVVTKPQNPEAISVPRLYRAPAMSPPKANFSSAANTYRNGTSCKTTASESMVWNASCTPPEA